MNAYTGVLEALIERGATGRGKGLKVSLFDAVADWMNVPLLYFEGTGRAPQRLGWRIRRSARTVRSPPRMARWC